MGIKLSSNATEALLNHASETGQWRSSSRIMSRNPTLYKSPSIQNLFLQPTFYVKQEANQLDPGDPLLCIFCMSPLSDTHKSLLISWWSESGVLNKEDIQNVQRGGFRGPGLKTNELEYSPWSTRCSGLEIDRYIGLTIFFPIFKHFTIIGYKKKNRYIKTFNFFFFFYLSHTQLYRV